MVGCHPSKNPVNVIEIEVEVYSSLIKDFTEVPYGFLLRQ